MFLVIAMDRQPRSRRGGPRSFSRDAAIETAMRLFWRHGYEGVSVSDLVGAIGIAPPSLYAAFGSKAGLYREALDRYAALPGALDGLGTAEDLEQAAAQVLGRAVRAVTAPGGERGCMVSTGMVQSGAEHADIARDLAARRRATRDAVALAFGRWLDPAAAGVMAAHLTAVMQGLAVQARDGASRGELEQVVGEVLAGIEARRAASSRDVPSR